MCFEVDGWLSCDLPLILSSMVGCGIHLVVWLEKGDVLLLLVGDIDRVDWCFMVESVCCFVVCNCFDELSVQVSVVFGVSL